MIQTVLVINLFSSFFLCGLIWTIQIVHYPMFLRLDKDNFTSHIAFYGHRISFIVAPMMVAELVTSAILIFTSPTYFFFHVSGFIAVSLIWGITFFVQVPLHNHLAIIRDKQTIHTLIRSNILRTIFWSIKAEPGIIILYRLSA